MNGRASKVARKLAKDIATAQWLDLHRKIHENDIAPDIEAALRAEYRRGQEEGRDGWVSVEERLPDRATWSGDRVLVYTEEGYIHTGLYEGEKATDDDPWWDKFNDSGRVTHWTPLPEPPEDDR